MAIEGAYQYYEGGLVLVLHTAKHSETLEDMVIFRDVRDDSIWVMPKSKFLESVRYKGALVPRYKKF